LKPLKLTSVDGIALDAAVHRPSGEGIGAVLQVHGITAEKDEGGMFVRLADRLANSGFSVVRFSFRGHGDSGGTQEGVTIAGEMLDLQAAVDYVAREYPGRLSIVASSFGAVSTLLSLRYLAERLTGLVLWNPVLDLQHTFLEPELSWGVENFGPAQQELLHSQGYLLVDGEFALGRTLFEEFRHYQPMDDFLARDLPSLIVHGDKDASVSYDIARSAAESHPNCTLHTVEGSDHGFDSPSRESEAIDATAEWLLQHHAGA
jgi:alpha-beta hydrolase superfamily lysophospholipase